MAGLVPPSPALERSPFHPVVDAPGDTPRAERVHEKSSSLRAQLFCLTAPATRWISKARLPTPFHFGFGAEVTELERLLSPGMVLLSRSPLRFANLVVPGYWKHAAICTSDGSAHGAAQVVESTVERGVAEVSLADFVEDKQALTILRPRVPRKALQSIAAEARNRIGAGYDFGFVDGDNGHYYCSKLVFDCLKSAMGHEPFPQRWHWGGPRGHRERPVHEQRHCFEVVFEARRPAPLRERFDRRRRVSGDERGGVTAGVESETVVMERACCCSE